MRRGRKQQRQPHPDPAVELRLQRILDLRASIDRRTDLIREYRHEISEFHSQARWEGSTKLAAEYNGRADELDAKIEILEDKIEETGGKIADLQAKIDPADLAFL
jgi:uncharacterized coiled-coil DUF342 family protein